MFKVMPPRTGLIFLVATLVWTGGCADLKVDVSMLNLTRYRANTSGDTDTKALADALKTLMEKPSATQPQSGVESQRRNELTAQLRAAADAQLEQLTAVRTESDWETDDSADVRIQQSIGRASAALTRVRKTANDILASHEGDDATKAAAKEVAYNTSDPSSGAQPKTPFGRTTDFVNQVNASDLLYLPKSYWRRNVNSVSGFGGFGNVDVAITASPEEGYGMKGVRVDSAKLIATTASLTRQLVATVAALYGIPTSLGSGPDGQTTPFDINADLQNVASATAAAGTQEANRKAAAAALIRQIGANADDLKSTDAPTRKAAIAAVKAAFEANKAALGSPAKTDPAAAKS